MGMSEAKRAKKLGKQVDGGHPRPDPRHPSGKSNYAQKKYEQKHSGNYGDHGDYGDYKVGRSAQQLKEPPKAEAVPPVLTASLVTQGYLAAVGKVSASQSGPVIDRQVSAMHRRDVAMQSTAQPNMQGKPWVKEIKVTEMMWIRNFISRFRRLPVERRTELLGQLQTEHNTSMGSNDYNAGSEFLRSITAINLVRAQATPFTSACMNRSIEGNPLNLEGDDARRFQTALSISLQRRNISSLARNGSHDFAYKFSNILVENFLAVIRNALSNPAAIKEGHSFFVTRASQGGYRLKPEIEAELRNFAQDCVKEHGHLIGTHFGKDGASR